jgi:hypothetical protein
MKRRSRAGGEPIKGQRRKTSEPERVNALKGQARSKLSPAIEETEVARLTRELTDERRQRVATSEVLRLLSGSHGDLNELFDTILANATNLVRPTSEHCLLAKATPSALRRCIMFPLALPSFADASPWSERVLCCVWLFAPSR